MISVFGSSGGMDRVCHRCGQEAKNRCGKCKTVLYCSSKCQLDDWAHHKLHCGATAARPKLTVFSLGDASILGAHVEKKGFALVGVPGIGKLTAAAVLWARRFFILPFEAKRLHGAGPGLGQQHGYMDLTWTETFEVRDHHDSRFHWPHPEFESSARALASSLRGVALKVLQLLCIYAQLDWAKVERDLLDGGHQPLATASHSALRILLYSKPATSAQEATTGHVFGTGDHTDNSFVTVAPCATVKGLEILPFDERDRWINVEEEMVDSDLVCVFVGDSLNKISAGRFPSVIHRPNEAACLRPLATAVTAVERQAVGRISTPYFLRGRLDAQLETPAGTAEPISVAQLEANYARCRETWPWKRKHQHDYYSLQKFSQAE